MEGQIHGTKGFGFNVYKSEMASKLFQLLWWIYVYIGFQGRGVLIKNLMNKGFTVLVLEEQLAVCILTY